MFFTWPNPEHKHEQKKSENIIFMDGGADNGQKILKACTIWYLWLSEILTTVLLEPLSIQKKIASVPTPFPEWFIDRNGLYKSQTLENIDKYIEYNDRNLRENAEITT